MIFVALLTLAGAPVDPTPLRAQFLAELMVPLEREPTTSAHDDLDTLGDRTRSTDRDKRTEARAQIVEVLGASYTAADALRWLWKNNLSDDDLLEALAATYAWYGKLDAVAAVHAELRNRAHGTPPDATLCRWRARETWASPPSPQVFTDPTCSRPLEIAQCPLVTGRGHSSSWANEAALRDAVTVELRACGPLIGSDSRTRTQARYRAAALAGQWPAKSSDPATWLAFARVAVATPWRSPELEDVALTAIENAATLAPCGRDERKLTANAALGLRDHDDHDKRFDARIDAVNHLAADTCKRRP